VAGWLGGWVGGWVAGWVGGWVGGGGAGWLGGWVAGWLGGWVAGWPNPFDLKNMCVKSIVTVICFSNVGTRCILKVVRAFTTAKSL